MSTFFDSLIQLLPLDNILSRAAILLACLFSFLIVEEMPAFAASIEVLTPQSGAKVIARTPETHLVLRAEKRIAKDIRVQKNTQTIDPIVSSEGDTQVYLHFRLPLVKGKNSFTLEPGSIRLEIIYDRIQSDLAYKKALSKDASFFHQSDLFVESCQECHDSGVAWTSGTVVFKNQDSCDSCHPNIRTRGAWQHSTTANGQCLICHLQSSSSRKIGFPTSKTQDLCFSCHTSKKAWLSRPNIHGPITLGGCTLCHNPHGDSYRYQLWAEGSLELCILCHSDKANLVATDKGKVPYVHGIIFGAGCIVCHDPHATDELYMLKKPINTLCSDCHPQVALKTVGHPVANHPVSAPRDPRRIGRKLTCTSCHDPHGSAYQLMLVQEKLGGRLCRECHKR